MITLEADGSVRIEDDFSYVHVSKKLDKDVHLFVGNYLESGMPLPSYSSVDNACASVSFVPLGAYLDDINTIRKVERISVGEPLMWSRDELIHAGKYADPPMDVALCSQLYDVCLSNDLRAFFEM